ncbi:MAG: hypothetical protein HYY52_02170, partial [Candidatus Melainabacteria bacterium]|nr:hypothetical protein [Candidatus Melainabacteria bacterium]
ANENDKVDLSYTLKSVKSVSVTANGKKPDGTIDKLIQLPPELKNKTDWAKSGIVTFTVPKEWGVYTEVIFTLVSGDESDSCSLKIGEKLKDKFEIGDSADTKVKFKYLGEERIISVKELREFLQNSGYGELISQETKDTPYTENLDGAFKTFGSEFDLKIEEARKYLQENFDTDISISEDGEIIFPSLETSIKAGLKGQVGLFDPFKQQLVYAEIYKDFTTGLKDGGINEVQTVIGLLKDPKMLSFLFAGGGILHIAEKKLTKQAIESLTKKLFIVGAVATSIDVTTQTIAYANAEPKRNGYQVGGFAAGKAFIALAGLDLIVKSLGQIVKYDTFISLIKTDKLLNFPKLKALLESDEIYELIITERHADQFRRFAKIINTLGFSERQLLEVAVTELSKLGKAKQLIQLIINDTDKFNNTLILEYALKDEVFMKGFELKSSNALEELGKDLASSITGVLEENDTYKTLSDWFSANRADYGEFAKTVSRINESRDVSTFVTPRVLRDYYLPERYKSLSDEQIIQRIINPPSEADRISRDILIGTISSRSNWVFITNAEDVKGLTALEINGEKGLGLDKDLKDIEHGLVEIIVDSQKLPSDGFRLPMAIFGNKYFKLPNPDWLSGITIGGFKEWMVKKFSALPSDGIIVKIEARK